MTNRQCGAIVAGNITAYRLRADIDASAVVIDAAGSRGDPGEPVADARSTTADTGTLAKHSRSIAEDLRPSKIEGSASGGSVLLAPKMSFLSVNRWWQTSTVTQAAAVHEPQHQRERAKRRVGHRELLEEIVTGQRWV